MEEVCQRFPLIAKKILNHIDNETFINFKKVSRNNADFLKKERFYWIRIIRRYNCLFGELHEVWKKVVSKTPVEIIKELAVTVCQFPPKLSKRYNHMCACMQYQVGQYRQCVWNETITSISPLDYAQAIEKQWHPLFVGATSSTPNLCSHIIQKAGVVKDPRLVNLTSGRNKMTPIVFTADFMGDVNVFELLLKNAEDKNPILSTINNWTLFHSLADKGDFQMCRSMVETVQDLSPRDIHGRTPCHIAALNGHEEVCYILMMHLTAINPKDNSGQTPLHLAASYGHLNVCRLLVETAKACMDENEMDDFLSCLQWSCGSCEAFHDQSWGE